MRERINFDETPEQKLERLRHSLLKKFPKKQLELSEQEKINLREVIQKIQYSYPLKDLLFYINAETANTLACSSHPVLREWGSKGKKFYESDPLNIYVQSETGLVRTPRLNGSFPQMMVENGYACYITGFSGYGLWNKKINQWVPSSCSQSSGLDAQYVLNIYLYSSITSPTTSLFLPPMNPPNFSKNPVDLISPLHVAAFIGNYDLMTNLITKGANFENDQYESVLELAITYEHPEIVYFLFQQDLDKEKVLTLTVEKGSFAIIEQLGTMNLPISDKVLNGALKRDHELHSYLNLKRSMDVQSKIKSEGALKALKNILNYSPIPIQSLVELIGNAPTIIHEVENKADENTLLHQLVNAKEVAKVTALLEAIFQAGFKKIDGFFFDIEKPNQQGKTLLDLALAQNNNDLTSAILLHNPKINQTQQSLLVQAKIDIPAIHQEKEKRTNSIIGQQSQQIEVQQQVLENTIVELIETKKEVNFLAQQLQLQEQMLIAIMQQLSMQPIQNQEPMIELPLPYKAANPNRLFALMNDQPNVINAQQNDLVIQQRQQG